MFRKQLGVVLAITLGAIAGSSRADVVVYSTAGGSAASNTNVRTPAGDADGVDLGNFNGSSVWSNATTKAAFQFTAGSNNILRGININLHMDENSPGGSVGSITGATLNWKLFATAAGGGGSSTSYTTTLSTAVGHGGSGIGANTYQVSNFDSNITLTAGTTYTLLLDTVTGITTSGDVRNDVLTWTYTASAPGNAGPTGGFTGVSIGTATTSNTGFVAGVGSNVVAFDVVAVPEPGTLALGGLASLAGVGGWWSRRKKKAVEAASA